MADVFTKAKRSEVMSRIRSRGNRDTELALARLLRKHGIAGWRRQVRLRVTSGQWQVAGKRQRRTSPKTLTPSPSPIRWARGASDSPQRGARDARGSVMSPVTRHLSLTVRPDFVFPESRTVIFVDGCFWHGCPRHATKPRNNAAFWRKKLAGNKARDRKVNRALRRAGWQVLRIWEHELQKRGTRNAERGTSRLMRRIQQALAAGRRNVQTGKLLTEQCSCP